MMILDFLVKTQKGQALLSSQKVLRVDQQESGSFSVHTSQSRLEVLLVGGIKKKKKKTTGKLRDKNTKPQQAEVDFL